MFEPILAILYECGAIGMLDNCLMSTARIMGFVERGMSLKVVMLLFDRVWLVPVLALDELGNC